MEKSFTVGILVSNHFGVLNRVAGLFAKRCYNIDSLAVGPTSNKQYSRMTIVAKGDDTVKAQVVTQLQKLHDVHILEVFDEENSVILENMLIKIRVSEDTKSKITKLINSFSGTIMDFSNETVSSEITGSSDKLDRFIENAREYGILEVCRSGAIAVSHGLDNMLHL